jgi:small subunit ribosomal protein S11
MPRRFKKTNVKKIRPRVNNGVIHVKASLHNTMVTITDFEGAVLGWSSAGTSGFKSKKKSSPFAAQVTTQNALYSVNDCGLKQADIMFNGPGKGRETSLRTILQSGLELSLIRDVTPLPHNGCRAPKKRRV